MTDFTRAISVQTDLFLEAIARTRPSEWVPTCPDWDADELLWHLTRVHAFWAAILREEARTDADSEAVDGGLPERPGTRQATIEMLRRETADLVAELERRSDDDPAWFWLDTAQTVGSTRRMQAHEAFVHRVDAELTAGIEPSGVDSDLAADGVAHAVSVMWAWWGTLPGFTFEPTAGIVELCAPGQSWLVQPGRWRGVGQSGKEYDQPGAQLVDRGTPAASLTGDAVVLDLWLWGRGPEPAADGDEESLVALREAQQVGMQ